MYIRNKVLYDENGKACVEGDKVKIFCDDGRILVDVITMVTNEQEKGFEDNEIYLRNGYVCAYDIHKVYKVITDIREKIEEYITELDEEIGRCTLWVEENMNGEACKVSEIEGRLKALTEVKNDLQGRLDELI